MKREHGDAPAARPTAYIEELHLGAFKSFVDQAIPFAELTLFIGRNASGKSNALDGLVVLSRLASGEDLRDALDGSRQDTEPVRGGADGCPPFGRDSFELGCRVRAGDELFDLAVTIQVRPAIKIVRESLVAVGGVDYAGRKLTGRELLTTEVARPGRMDIEARYFNGKRGPKPFGTFIGQPVGRYPGSRPGAAHERRTGRGAPGSGSRAKRPARGIRSRSGSPPDATVCERARCRLAT